MVYHTYIVRTTIRSIASASLSGVLESIAMPTTALLNYIRSREMRESVTLSVFATVKVHQESKNITTQFHLNYASTRLAIPSPLNS
jgi:formaldehyde-activating enzyme involved in methanogenesis